eukprot:5962077-Ditylum_brightwellii.AAC.2
MEMPTAYIPKCFSYNFVRSYGRLMHNAYGPDSDTSSSSQKSSVSSCSGDSESSKSFTFESDVKKDAVSGSNNESKVKDVLQMELQTFTGFYLGDR